MPPEDFHAERRKGIFSTDLSAVLGIDRYGRGPLDIAVAKLANYQQPQTESMGWGHVWEPILGEFYTRETGHRLVKTQTMWHPTIAWAGAHGDFLKTPQEHHLVDAKWTTQRQGWGEPGTDQVPADIVVQMQWQMFCSTLERADIAALVCGEFKIYTIPRNEELIGLLHEAGREFWEMIQRGETPAPDWSAPQTPELIKHLYRPDPKIRIELSPAATDLATSIQSLGELRRKFEKEEERKKAELTCMLGTASVGILPGTELEVRRSVITVKYKAKAACESEQVRLTIAKRKDKP